MWPGAEASQKACYSSQTNNSFQLWKKYSFTNRHDKELAWCHAGCQGCYIISKEFFEQEEEEEWAHLLWRLTHCILNTARSVDEPLLCRSVTVVRIIQDAVADVQAIKVYGGVKLKLPSFLVLALDDMSSQLHALAAFPAGK